GVPPERDRSPQASDQATAAHAIRPLLRAARCTDRAAGVQARGARESGGRSAAGPADTGAGEAGTSCDRGSPAARSARAPTGLHLYLPELWRIPASAGRGQLRDARVRTRALEGPAARAPQVQL